MTFGFSLIVSTHHEHVDSDQQEAHLDLAEPIGRVALHAWPSGVSFSDADQLLFTGSGYESLQAANKAGLTLKDAIRLAGVAVGKGIDVRKEARPIRLGQYTIDQLAQSGVMLLPEVLGLSVYEETGTPVIMSARAVGRAIPPPGSPSPIESFSQALQSLVPQAVDLSDKRKLACDLFAQSLLEFSPGSQHLALCTALEVLSTRQERSGRAAELVEDFRKAILQARDESTDEAERDQLQTLLSGANDLRKESIGGAIKRLAASIPSDEIGGWDPAGLASKSYKARSDLVHEGAMDQDFSKFSGLADLVRHLCLSHPEKAEEV